VLAVAVMAALALGVIAASTAAAAPRAASTKCADPSGTVKVGMTYFGAVAQAYSSVGGDASQAPGDKAMTDNYKAGIDALNAAGGLAGCQVEAVIYNFPSGSPDYNQESQKVCAFFTQDNDVIAVFSGAYETKVAIDCYAKAKVPFFASGGKYVPSCDDLKKYAGYLYYPLGVGSCRFNSLITMWDKGGLFPKDAKVGILAADDGTGQGQYVADKVYGPALKKLKIPYETFSYHLSTSVADFANTNSTLAPAVLKFKADGVNVVIFTPAGGAGSAAFLPQALNQGYFPAYGLHTPDNLPVAAALGANAIKEGVGISWWSGDLPLTTQQTLPANPAVPECATWTVPNQVYVNGVSPYCDFLNLLSAGFKGATNTKPTTLAKGLDALGTTFDSSVTYGGATKYGKNAYGGIAVAQTLQFDPNLKQWTLTSPQQKPVALP
jgi:hypothetical protein